MSQSILHYRIVKTGNEQNQENKEQHVIFPEAVDVFKKRFGNFVKALDEETREEYLSSGYSNNFLESCHCIEVIGKQEICYTFRSMPNFSSFPFQTNHYLFTKEEVQSFYEQVLQDIQDDRTDLFHEQILKSFKEGKDFLVIE